MEKKNKKKSRSKFAEAIDPRFTGIFKSSNLNVNNPTQERSVFQKEEISDGDKGFRDFLSNQLFDYIDSQIKIVDIPEDSLSLYKFEADDVRLFSNSHIVPEDTITEEAPRRKKKKKKDKKSEKECFKEVAVTADWLEKQAKLFNS